MEKARQSRLTQPTTSTLHHKLALHASLGIQTPSATSASTSDKSNVNRVAAASYSLLKPTTASIQHKLALEATLFQVKPETDPFWALRGGKADKYKGSIAPSVSTSTSAASKIREETASSVGGKRAKVLSGREKLEWERAEQRKGVEKLLRRSRARAASAAGVGSSSLYDDDEDDEDGDDASIVSSALGCSEDAEPRATLVEDKENVSPRSNVVPRPSRIPVKSSSSPPTQSPTLAQTLAQIPISPSSVSPFSPVPNQALFDINDVIVSRDTSPSTSNASPRASPATAYQTTTPSTTQSQNPGSSPRPVDPLACPLLDKLLPVALVSVEPQDVELVRTPESKPPSPAVTAVTSASATNDVEVDVATPSPSAHLYAPTASSAGVFSFAFAFANPSFSPDSPEPVSIFSLPAPTVAFVRPAAYINTSTYTNTDAIAKSPDIPADTCSSEAEAITSTSPHTATKVTSNTIASTSTSTSSTNTLSGSPLGPPVRVAVKTPTTSSKTKSAKTPVASTSTSKGRTPNTNTRRNGDDDRYFVVANSRKKG